MGATFLLFLMSPNTAVCLILVGLSLVFMNVQVGRWRPSQLCALSSAATSLAACIGHAYDVRALYGIAGYANMAVHTAITLLILSLGLLFAQASRWHDEYIQPGRASRNAGPLPFPRLPLRSRSLADGFV